MSKRVRRLYDNFKPEHYSLSLIPDRETMTFRGSVTITGQKVGRPSSRLTFHQKDLSITTAKVVKVGKKDSEPVHITRFNRQKTYDELRLHSDRPMYPGRYKITLAFTGTITRPMQGIYPSFFDHNGVEQKLIATQFESHHAREAFPCIDEPEAKATFDLTLTTPKGEAVLANTPAKSQKVIGTSVVTTFESTPKMSTYLLAFVFGNLQHLEDKTKGGVVVRSYATPGNSTHTRFALDVAVKCLEFYNEYYGIAYPLPKCDLVALPDFANGAMENWGLITFREQTLLVDTKNTSLPVKQFVAMVVAHELAHQWFGNLVTMRWWTDLWLNEGFASWMEYVAVDHIFPQWHIWNEFVVNDQEAGLKLDALEYTHPIEVTINHPDEIRTIFDTISYSKGSSVIHMLHQYLGPESFRKGLHHYLKTHAYGNTDTVDLWTALEADAHKPVKSFMHTWTSQSGFPIVEVDAKSTVMSVKQERFYVNPKAQKTATTWPVPLLASTTTSQETLETATEQLATTPTRTPLTLNSGRFGFYRVTYDSEHIARLSEAVANGRLSVLDRLGLLSDAFEAAKAGYGSSVDALKLLAAYAHEDNTFVWDVMVGGLGSIRAVMNDNELREVMKPFARQLVAEQLERLGWEPLAKETHFDTLLRPTILSLASLSETKSVVTEALHRFATMKHPEDINPDLRGVIYGTAARNGGQTAFDKLLTLHNNSKNSEERVVLSAALTGFKQPRFIKEALSQIDSETVRLQDATYWVAYSFMNHYARDLTWEWMTSHWHWLESNLGSDLSFYRFPNYAARAFSDTKYLPAYKQFFAMHMSPAFERPVNQGIETIEWQAAWRKRDLTAIKAFFTH